QIIGPPERDRLEPELCFNLEGPLCITDKYGIADLVATAEEIGVVQCIALRRNFLFHFSLIESLGQEPIVFNEAQGREKTGCWYVVRADHDVFVDLDLIDGIDLSVVRLKTSFVCVVIVTCD